MNYYNEIDPYCAEWLRNLIDAGLIPYGDVDERSIEDVLPAELAGYTQCHFFAGAAVWPLALRTAGWPDNRPVWTGSCPCQPFSQTGKNKGVNDERHLWPVWYDLISEAKPSALFGEQVASVLTIGKISDDSDMHSVPSIITLGGFSDLFWGEQERATSAMQSVPKRVRKGMEGQTSSAKENSAHTPRGQGFNLFQTTSSKEQGSLFSGTDPQAMRKEEYPIRPRSIRSRSSRKDQCGAMRSKRSHAGPVPDPGKARLFWDAPNSSFTGPDRPVEGLFDEQHPSSMCGGKFCDGELGGRCLLGDSEGMGREELNVKPVVSGSIKRSTRIQDERTWIDTVFSDMENAHYTCGAAVITSVGVGAPNIRQRLYWVADSGVTGPQGRLGVPERGDERATGADGVDGRVAQSIGMENWRRIVAHTAEEYVAQSVTTRGLPERLGDGWDNLEWALCRDPKGAVWRCFERGHFPLSPRNPSTVGRLRAYGNSLNHQAAAAFVASFCEARE